MTAETPDISLRLPLPPSANKIWRRGQGRFYRAENYRDWCRHVGQLCMIQGAGDRIPWRYAMRIVLPEQRRDIDNVVKPTSDALMKARVIEDDKHARRIVIEVDEKREPDTMLVELWSLGEAPPAKRRRLKLTRQKAPALRQAGVAVRART